MPSGPRFGVQNILVPAAELYREIDNELGSSPITVGVAMNDIREMLHVGSTKRVVRWCNEQGRHEMST